MTRITREKVRDHEAFDICARIMYRMGKYAGRVFRDPQSLEVIMSKTDNTIYCDGCGVEITWSPVIIGLRDYCCEDCREGLPCRCGERMEQEEERRGTPSEE